MVRASNHWPVVVIVSSQIERAAEIGEEVPIPTPTFPRPVRPSKMSVFAMVEEAETIKPTVVVGARASPAAVRFQSRFCSARPKVAEPVMFPHRRLPELSVERAAEPEQEGVWVRARELLEMVSPPPKVEVAVVEVAKKVSAEMAAAEEALPKSSIAKSVVEARSARVKSGWEPTVVVAVLFQIPMRAVGVEVPIVV